MKQNTSEYQTLCYFRSNTWHPGSFLRREQLSRLLNMIPMRKRRWPSQDGTALVVDPELAL